MKADFVAQSSEPENEAAVQEWFREMTVEAHEAGMTWMRYSKHEDHWIWLVEGWKERPKEQGEPSFQMEMANDL